MNSGLPEWLRGIDSEHRPLDESEILTAASKHRTEVESHGDLVTSELQADHLAFALMPSHRGRKSNWGTHYGPNSSWETADGELREAPGLEQIQEASIVNWEKRAREVSHPVLRYRFASLAWDLARKGNRKPNSEMATRTIDSALDSIGQRLCRRKHDCIEFAKYAIMVALQIRDEGRLAKMRDTVLAFEDDFAQDRKCGTWGHAYDLLVSNKRSGVTDEQLDKILKDLEDRLVALSEVTAPIVDTWAAQQAVRRLAEFYRRTNRRDDMHRVLKIYADAFENAASRADGGLAVSWLDQAHRFLIHFDATKLANGLNTAMRKAGQRAVDEMHERSATVTIPREEIESIVNRVVTGSLEESVTNLVFEFIPIQEQSKEQVEQRTKEFITDSIFSPINLDGKGRIISRLGVVEEDLDGHVVAETAKVMQYLDVFLRMAIEALVQKHLEDRQSMIDFIFGSPVMIPVRRSIVETALSHYFNGRWLEFIHLIVPQIEAAVRNIVIQCEGTFMKQGRHGSMMLRNLDELLQEPCFGQLFASWGETVVHYLRVLLTDQRGWNIRNSISHGLTEMGGFSPLVADRLFHVLLVLSLVRTERQNQSPT